MLLYEGLPVKLFLGSAAALVSHSRPEISVLVSIPSPVSLIDFVLPIPSFFASPEEHVSIVPISKICNHSALISRLRLGKNGFGALTAPFGHWIQLVV